MTTVSGLGIFKDTGAPAGRSNYTTLVITHGYVWHGAIFSKVLQLAASHGVRIIVLNRRDYPGSIPYTPEELALLPPVLDKPLTDPAEIRSDKLKLEKFMRDRARELYDSLEDLVQELDIPPVRPGAPTGGIVLVGWSLGATWMLALLRHVAEFPVNEINLRDYIRRVVLWDPPNCLLHYPEPEEDDYNPLFDTTQTFEERGKEFIKWITAYFSHGNTTETFERRAAAKIPPSTLANISQEEYKATMYPPAGTRGGSDFNLLYGCHALRVYETLRKGAFFLPTSGRSVLDGKPLIGDDWRDVEVRYAWGDHSVWECPYAARAMRQEIDAARRGGKAVRNVTILRVRGANHFAHWDYPERTLRAFLANPKEHENRASGMDAFRARL
ncbi:Alpha/Beta hydrolase protein [Trametes meyenii]|nr:Alpha/Beta hydrolase protein [Trametes meyenii]